MSALDALARGATVVTVGGRLERHLRWRYDRAQAAAGKSTWLSPDVLPWNAWLERLWTESMLVGGEAGQYDLLTPRQARLVWRELVDAQGNIGGDGTAAEIAARAWQLARDWRIPVSTLQRAAFSPDTEAFASWAGAYEARCRERGWIDPWVLPERLIEDLAAGRIAVDGPVGFAGFDAPTAQQSRMFEAVPSTLHETRSVDDASVRRVACAEPRRERELIARWARNAFEKSSAGLVGIVATNLPQMAGTIRRTCLDVLAPDWRSMARGDLPVSAAQGRALASVGLVHAGLLALQLGERRIDYRDLGQLLRSPYLSRGVEESSGRAALDVWLRDRGRLQIELRWLASAEVPGRMAPDFVTLVRNAFEWAESKSESHEPGGWASRFAKFLRTCGWPTGRDLGRDEHEAFEAWARLLDDFASCGRVVGELNRTDARRLLISMAREQIFEPGTRADGVQIMSPDDASGIEFDALWVCGLSSDAWPPPVQPNPLIPLELQRKAGVPQANPQQIRQAATASMQRLWASAPEVFVSWPRENDQGELVCSPMLEPFAETDADAIDRYAGETFRARVFRNRRLEFSGPDPAPALAADETGRGGSRLMKIQGACPARAFFEFRLGAREMPVPLFGIDALERGNIIHDALELLYAGIKALGGIGEVAEDKLQELIGTSIDDALRPHFAGRDAFGRALLDLEASRARQLLAQLTEFDRRREPFGIEATERSDTVTVGPLRLKLRQDRIDRTGQGARLVIDYKTGRLFSINAWRGERPAEPQLPLYAATGSVDGIAAIALNRDGISFVGVGAEGLGVEGLKTPADITDREPANWPDIVDGWRRTFEQLAAEYASGDVRIDSKDTTFAEAEFAMLTRVYARDEGGPR